MNILYLVNFNLSEKKGLGLITKNKIKSLRNIGNDVTAISSPFKNSYAQILYGLVSDIKASYHLVKHRPEFMISRGPIGLFSILISRKLGITTVREVHAYAIEEVNLLPYKGLNLFALKILAHFSHLLDLNVDLRIFNHPDLLDFYKSKGLSKDSDFYVYNGYSVDNKSPLTKEASKKKYKLTDDVKYLIFAGSATKWHGVDYLIQLQNEFNENGDLIQIVCGGANISQFDKNQICINITPLDAKGCSELIRAADLCLLPVRNNRVSPGSPLKLYDYIVNERPIVAQKDMKGYCDEVIKHEIGFCVDFSEPKATRQAIIDYFKSNKSDIFPKVNASWDDRMLEWFKGMKKVRNIKY